MNNLPQRPGVYLFSNSEGQIIYVGKAKSLKSRVGSYFKINLDTSSKTHALVSNINDVNFIEVTSELEALILEAELIKKYDPKYNIQLKDDKSYLYLAIRNEFLKTSFGKIRLPSVLALRKNQVKSNDVNFGPYPSGNIVKYIVKTIRKLFPYRDCSQSKFAKYNKLKSPCLFGHIKMCPAPCVYSNSEDLKSYQDNIKKIKNLLSGKTESVLKDIEKQMQFASKSLDFEKAAKYRDLLNKFNYVRQNFRSADDYIDNPYLIDDITQASLKALVEVLPFLKKEPLRIECYDISNISGKEAVGSMVVATDGKIDKLEYKRFKVNFKNTPDDFDMLYEVLYRRFNHHPDIKNKLKKWPVPDLVVLDGGKGQVSAGLAALQDLGLEVPLIGLAKKFETIVLSDKTEVKLPHDNAGLKLLIQLRDESHRFAQKYHHLLRKKSLTN